MTCASFVLLLKCCFLGQATRIPPNHLIGAYLNYGKLNYAQNCAAKGLTCGKPDEYYNKRFKIRNMEWNDLYYDPETEQAKVAMEEVTKKLNKILFENKNMKDSGANGVFIKSIQPNKGDIDVEAQIAIRFNIGNTNLTMEEMIGKKHALKKYDHFAPK